MIDYEDPQNWSKQYVSSHHIECLRYLREINVGAIRYIESHRYYTAFVGMMRISKGLEALMQIGETDRLRSCTAALSYVMAEFIVLADPVAMKNEIRDVGLQPKEDLFHNAREIADIGLEAAQHFATNAELRNRAASMARALNTGASAESIRRYFAPDFPKDIHDILLELDDDFFVPEIRQYAPDQCVVLDKEHLILTRQVVGKPSSYTPTNYGPVEMPADTTYKTSLRSKPGSDFDTWVQMNGWDEEDLERAYKKVKLRRNIYGMLSFFPPFGVILLPFWLRAVYLTKAIRYRSWNVDSNILTKIIILIYGIPTLFIYPIIMGHIVKWSNWGMGLGDRKAFIPAVAVLALVAFLIFRASGIPLPDVSGPEKFSDTTSASDEEQTELPAEEAPDDSDDVQLYQDSGFVFPDSDTELIVQHKINNLSDSDLTYAINEIYARHGYIFRSDELRRYYEQFSWYIGKIPADEFSVDCFNQIEQQNWNLLVKERNRRTSPD